MRRIAWFAGSMLLAGLLLAPGSAGAGRNQRLIAVFDFDYSTVTNESGETPVNIGSGLADMLVTELVKDGTYTVVERKRLEKVMEEQKLDRTAGFDAATAAEIGKLVGVSAIVIGSVTRFGTEKSTVPVGSGSDLYGGTENFRAHKQKAVVGIDVRMVDTETGVILLAANAVGEDQKAMVAQGGTWGTWGGSDRSFSDISQQLVGGAAEKAVVQIVDQLVEYAGRVQAQVVKGLVADVEGDTVVTNLGTADGLSVGTVLIVERIYKVIHDPADAKKILRSLGKQIATMRVEQVDEGSSVCRVLTTVEGEVIKSGYDVLIQPLQVGEGAASGEGEATKK